MSLETKIDQLTQAVNHLIGVLQQGAVVASAGAVNVAAPPVQQAAPVWAPPIAEAVILPTPAMPAPPTFAPPAPPAAPAGAPFNDIAGLIAFTTSAYKALEAAGAGKGAGIQSVLTGLGHANINDVQPAQYAAFAAGIEALR